MTREDVKKLFPEATDEQITKLLNQSNSEIAREKSKAEKLKSDFKELQGYKDQNEKLQEKLAEMEQDNLSEIEKASKALETANQRIAELEKSQFISNQRADAVSNFKITAEQAKEIVKDDGSFDMVKLGQIMTEKESAAALAKEQEIAAASSNPNGQHNDNSGENTTARDLAVASAKRAGVANRTILDNYRRN